MASFLAQLNTPTFVAFSKLGDLTLGKPYLIVSAKLINTKYGKKVSVLLEGNIKVILPTRYTTLAESSDSKLLEYLESGKIYMIYRGIKTSGSFKMHDLEFLEWDNQPTNQ